MANLPDLNTAAMGLTAFWNVNAAITAADMTNIAANLNTFTTYDNGIDGRVRVTIAGGISNPGGTFEFHVRVRTDGLILVWMLRANDPDLLGTATAAERLASGAGYPASRGALLTQSANGSRTGTTLWAVVCDALENLMTTTPFKTVVNTATVGHYDFQYPTMTKIYVLGEELSRNGTGTTSDSFTFTQPSSGNGILMVAFNKSGRVAGTVSGSFTSSATFNVVSISTNSNTNADHGQRYYTFAPNHTNWPVRALATINDFSAAVSNGTNNSTTVVCGYLVIYAVET